jgi:FKBP-type peptidyl-prolyl cis-trans isomerase FkpA
LNDFRRKTNMNFVSTRHTLSCAIMAALLIAQGVAHAQAPTQGPQPAPPGTPGPPIPTGNIAGPQPATGAAAIMPLPKGAQGNAPMPINSSISSQPIPIPIAPKFITKNDTLPAKVADLTIRDDVYGEGAPVLPGQAVSVQYTGWLYDAAKPEGKGTQFDSSRTRPLPFGFMLGAGRVIKGWDQGLVGMKPKGKRTLIIPSQLAYGPNAKGDKIPANSTLIFEVELVDILSPAPGGASGAPKMASPGSAQTPMPMPTPKPMAPPVPTTPN